MAGKKVYRELAEVSEAALPARLHALLANGAISVFRERADPNTLPGDELISHHLTTPLQWLLCAGDPAAVFAGLEQSKAPAAFCGKVFKSGEPAYFCKDCQTDPTCCLCMECFEHSEHKNHRYRFFASGGGGCCDCGDPEAWTSGVYCEQHQPAKQAKDQEDVDPLAALSPALVSRAKLFLTALLKYCMEVLMWKDPHNLPPFLNTGLSKESLAQDRCVTLLFNDEVHSFDEVIGTLQRNLAMTRTEAVAMATSIDRKGRAVVKTGASAECDQAEQDINSVLANNPLNIEVYHEAIAVHQNTAIICLSLAKDLTERSPAFCRLLSVCLCTVEASTGTSMLDKFFLNDSQLWISARVGWHRLVMSSVFMDSVYKKQLAITLARNYLQLQKNFLEDSHDHDVCASNITVQIFTAPSLSKMLVLEHGILKTIVDTLLEVLTPCVHSGTYRLTPQNYNHSRVFYIMHDLRYVLRNIPEVWCDRLRLRVREAFDSILELLRFVQNASCVRRVATGLHVEREEPWEHIFNFSIVLQPSLLLLCQWVTSDRELLKYCAKATVEKHIQVARMNTTPFRQHTCSQELIGQKKVELITFDIIKDPVSLHQPLPRIIACLMTGAAAHGLSIQQLLELQPNDQRTPLFLIEHACRAIVMAIQVMAGMWKRNGYSVVNQIVNYQFHYSREIMYDKDILILQSMASVMDLNVLTYALIYKFRLEKWINGLECDPTQRPGEPADDALRFFINEAEDFLFLLITIFTGRHSEGVGVGVSKEVGFRREIIHRLYITPYIHSQIMKLFRLNDSDNMIDRILKEVAVQRRVGNKMMFELKQECESEYDPFYFHYNRMEHSKAHEAFRKRNKTTSGAPKPIVPAPPPEPPEFTAPFKGIMRFPQCPVIHRVLSCVLRQASIQTSKVWSDKLIHEALYLLAAMLREEDSSLPNSLRSVALGQGKVAGDGLVQHLEALRANRRADEYLPLLEWILQYLATPDETDGEPVPMEVTPVVSEEPQVRSPPKLEPDVDEEAKKRRKKLAAERRNKLMNQMAGMQKDFLRKHQEELEALSRGSSSQGYDVPDVHPTECGVGLHSRGDKPHPPQDVTCILCQEDSGDISSENKVLVQNVYIMRSAVLRKGAPEVKEDRNLLVGRANMSHGLFTGGCGHYLHTDCWSGFIESKQRERRRPLYFTMPGQSVQLDKGEFLCPLCQSPCNTVLPLLKPPAVSPAGQPPVGELGLAEWLELGAMAIELAEGDPMETNSSSVDPTFHDKVAALFPSYKPQLPSASSQRDSAALDSALNLFTQRAFTKEYACLEDPSDVRVCVSLWNICAYTIAGLERNARANDKFVLAADTLSVRQIDFVKSLVRLGSLPQIAPPLLTLASYVRNLGSVLLQDSVPPFTEEPCLLELDSFSVLVSLHFSHALLYTLLTSSGGTLNAALPPLVGIADQHIVRVTTSAHILQYLLATPPAESGQPPERAGSSPEFSVGMGLQSVWVQYRKAARLASSPAPSPYDLYAGVQQHLYPFLECATVFFHYISGVDLIYSSDSVATRFDDMCRYLRVPVALHTLFDDSPQWAVITKLAANWCSHPRLKELLSAGPPVSLLSPRKLYDLPDHFSELVKKASSFRCASRSSELVDDSQTTMLCLVCGELLCSNSYCCQTETSIPSGSIRVGGLNTHARRCGAGLGMALWILECHVVLLDCTDPAHITGCTVTPPYLDEYEEADPGLRRGNPLKLNEAILQELNSIWFSHRIPERISKETEDNHGLMRISWQNM